MPGIDYSKRKFFMVDKAVNSQVTTVYQAKNVIFSEGDMGNELYEVVSGTVGIYLNYGKINQMKVAEKKPGEYFGEVAITEKRPRTATCVAEEDETKLLVVTSVSGFMEYIRKHPENLEPILDGMSNRIKNEKAKYIQACQVLAEYKNAVESGKKLSDDLQKDVDFYATEPDRISNDF